MIRNTRILLRWKPQGTLASPVAKHHQPASITSLSSSNPARVRIGLNSRPFLPLVHRQFYAKVPNDKIDRAAEKELAHKKLEAHPEKVTTRSTTRQVFEPSPSPAASRENVTEGLRHDVNIVKDTFKLDDVPKEPYILGLAGTLPYLGTSIVTVYLSWDLNTTWPTGSALLNHLHLNHADAQSLLNLLEPIQLGYGAVIISFLGAIHWGMEYAAQTPDAARTRFRYGMGVLAPAIAWPTLLMPIESALTAQFAAFTALYLADSRATTRDWAPTWYGRYRFILTAVVGLAIFVSLVGRAKIGAAAPRLGQGLSDKMHVDLADTKTNWAALEAEEKKKNRKKKEEEKKRKEKEETDEKKAQDKPQDKENSKSQDQKEGKNEGKEAENKDSSDEEKKEAKDEAKQKSKSKSKDEDKSKDKE